MTFPDGPVPDPIFQTAKKFVAKLTPTRRAEREAMLAWAGNPDGTAREVAVRIVIHSAHPSVGIARGCVG